MSAMVSHPAEAASAAPIQAVATPGPCRAAGTSFGAGLVAIRLCWLPGVNCVLAMAALVFGGLAIWEIAHGRGLLTGMDEAVSGIVLGALSLGLSIFFLSLLFAALR